MYFIGTYLRLIYNMLSTRQRKPPPVGDAPLVMGDWLVGEEYGGVERWG